MLCPSCGTNVGTEARLCRACNAGGSESPRRGTSTGPAADPGLATAMSSSLIGVITMLSAISYGFGIALQKIFVKISLFDGVLIALTTALLVASIMGGSLINGARIGIPSRMLRVLIGLTFVYCALELYRRPIIEYALARTKTSIETDESVKDLQRSDRWLDAVKDDLRSGAGKLKSAVKSE